jgi:hypothetical protein
VSIDPAQLDSAGSRVIPLPSDSVCIFWVTCQIALLFLLCLQLQATSIHPSHFAREQFAQVLDASAKDSSRSEAALQFLGSIALNEPSETAATAYAQLARGVLTFDHPLYQNLTVRAEAFYAIGRLATPAAIALLEAATLATFSAEERDELGPSIQIALRNARRLQLPSLPEQWRYLSSLLREEVEGPFYGYTSGWATEQLCNLGALEYLPEVSVTYRRISRETAEADTQFCQERMWVVASHSDRPTALASALTVENAVNKPRLVNWAIRQLKEDRQPGSAARVDAYLKELIALPRSSPMRQAALYNVVKSHIPPTQNPGIY